MKKRTFSIRTSVILCLLVSIIPVDLMFIVFSNHSIRSIFEKTEESYRMSIDSAAAVFEESFRDIENGLAALYINSIDVRYLKNAATPEERYHYAYSLSQDLSVAAGSAGVSFVYDGRQFYFSMGQDISAEDKRSMRYSSFFTALQSQESFDTSGWLLEPAGDSWVLARIVGGGGVYIGKAVLLGGSLAQDVLAPSANQLVYFAGPDGVPITEIGGVAEEQLLSLDDAGDSPFFLFPADSYLTVEHPFDTLPAILVCAVSSASLISDLRFSQAVFWGLILLSAFSVAFTLLFLHWRVTKPLKDLRGNILSLRNSAYEWRSGSGAAREIQQVYDTFDSMTEEIKELRIRFYEEELQKQQYRLQYYQLQLKPHFYLNSLKSLYGLAQNGNNEEIQKMLLSLSEQFQYIAYDLTAMIPLGEELTHTQNYVNIQKIGKGFPIHVTLSAESGLSQVEVPSLILQTFVENSIKYAPVYGRTLRISIAIRLEDLDGESYLHIQVADNGAGYPEQLLEDFYAEDAGRLKGHIGLFNLRARLSLIYGERAYFILSNKDGAVSEIFLPVNSKKEETANGTAAG